MYTFQKVSLCGAQVVTVPYFRITEVKATKHSEIFLIDDSGWIYMENIVGKTRSHMNWYGWILVLLTNEYFPTNRTKNKNPFILNQVLSNEEI